MSCSWRTESGRRRPVCFDRDGLLVSRPWWHRHTDDRERFRLVRAELESCPDRDGQRDAGLELDDLVALGRRSPHVAATAYHEPDLVHRAVYDSTRQDAGRECEVR